MKNRGFMGHFITSGITFLLLVHAQADPETGTPDIKGNGFGEDYDWVSLENGFRLAQETKRPLMLVLYKPWCGACKALKPKFAESSLLKDLSKDFVMVNSDDDGGKELYQPDGGYIPRILFFDSDGTLLRDVINEGGSPGYKYFYREEESIARSMRAVLRRDEEQAESESETANKAEL